MQNCNKSQGFTLLELIVTVLIVSILAAIAIPSYRSYVIRANESETQSIMLAASNDLEKWSAKTLSFRGFNPTYLNNTDTFFSPSGATNTDYKYEVTINDATINGTSVQLNPLTSGNADGRFWRMVAKPNNTGIMSAAKYFYLDSTGAKCAFDTAFQANRLDVCSDVRALPWG